MSAPESVEVRDEEHARARPFEWWHHSHPTFAALTGFFSGMLFVTAVPGGFAALLRLLFSYDRAEKLFPWVAVFLVVPIVLLARRKTRRFGQYMALGMLLTALVVGGVASLVLYFMVRADA
ncbi:hypothetical protein EXE58_00810 [Nocardioides seonyuensis]|uniref:Uncharacterized protein n=1 Tax=Nocardioides seonyuensis TaxID=2518371 RepID=A0A4P7IAW9_9ACTN|nr:hypothetical protein [Nocardioides seonyuensis]QBX54155.1 hypothetical protein EXE58_00810 [Nocardioides seonyuensis]